MRDSVTEAMAEVPDSCLRAGMQPVVDTLVKDVARDLVTVSNRHQNENKSKRLRFLSHFISMINHRYTCPSYCRVSRCPVNPQVLLPQSTHLWYSSVLFTCSIVDILTSVIRAWVSLKRSKSPSPWSIGKIHMEMVWAYSIWDTEWGDRYVQGCKKS